jgi:hypothetical protein
MSDGANIEYYIGEVITLRLTCLEDDGTPSDLSGYTAGGWVKQSPRDETDVIDLDPTIDANVVEVDAPSAGVLAGNYTWRVFLLNGDDEPIVIGNGNLKLRA